MALTIWKLYNGSIRHSSNRLMLYKWREYMDNRVL
jgi:hypothetical protein